MYKAFLSLRYLRTRYIAMASIVSVMLGVATMIVVNSVMKGFTSEMREPHPGAPFGHRDRDEFAQRGRKRAKNVRRRA